MEVEVEDKYMKNLKNSLLKHNIPIIKRQDFELNSDQYLGKDFCTQAYKGTYKGQVVCVKEVKTMEVNCNLDDFINGVNVPNILGEHERIPNVLGVAITEYYIYTLSVYINNSYQLQEKVESVDYKQKINYFVQLASIVNDLNKKNIVHRDLKPMHAIISGDKVYLVNFGLSIECKGEFTKDTDAKGTIIYMPPESHKCDNDNIGEDEEIDELSKQYTITKDFDIWSLGCMISECISGMLPWSNFNWKTIEGNKDIKIKKKNKINEIKVREFLGYDLDFPIPEGIKPELKEILKKCFEIDIHKRIKSQELYEKLKTYYESL